MRKKTSRSVYKLSHPTYLPREFMSRIFVVLSSILFRWWNDNYQIPVSTLSMLLSEMLRVRSVPNVPRWRRAKTQMIKFGQVTSNEVTVRHRSFVTQNDPLEQMFPAKSKYASGGVFGKILPALIQCTSARPHFLGLSTAPLLLFPLSISKFHYGHTSGTWSSPQEAQSHLELCAGQHPYIDIGGAKGLWAPVGIRVESHCLVHCCEGCQYWTHLWDSEGPGALQITIWEGMSCNLIYLTLPDIIHPSTVKGRLQSSQRALGNVRIWMGWWEGCGYSRRACLDRVN